MRQDPVIFPPISAAMAYGVPVLTRAMHGVVGCSAIQQRSDLFPGRLRFPE